MYKILSSIPRQMDNHKDKLTWIDEVCKEHKPHLLVTPQEFFGGIMMPKKPFFTFDELYPKLKRIIKKHNVALVVGVVERENNWNKEVVWFINEKAEFLGKVAKFALPRYDHINTNGVGDIEPETDFNNRFQIFEFFDGLRVSAIFCWEAYSDLLWTGLGIMKPDVIFSMIKFGVNSWPQVEKKDGKACVKGFGYGTWSENGRWVERLHMANKWQVKCPIICTTNSWNLRPISMPLCGCISNIDGQANHTFYHPKKEDKLKTIPEKIIVDEIDPNKVRGALMNKFVYKDAVGHFPPYDLAKYTMMLKINRIEARLLSGREEKDVNKKKAKRKGGLGL